MIVSPFVCDCCIICCGCCLLSVFVLFFACFSVVLNVSVLRAKCVYVFVCAFVAFVRVLFDCCVIKLLVFVMRLCWCFCCDCVGFCWLLLLPPPLCVFYFWFVVYACVCVSFVLCCVSCSCLL